MFRVDPKRRISHARIGAEGLPLVCIDGFVSEPQELIEHARDAMFVDAGSNYPGVRAPAPNAYVDALLDAIAEPVAQTFGAALSPDLEMCAFSMVTMPPSRLQRGQRIPHFDGAETHRIAFIHYLCDPGQGGTSFYRHRATGLAQITPRDLDRYRLSLAAELADASPAQGYVSEGTRLFECIHRVDAVFNRLIIYKGNVLHSGDIGPATVLSEDPRQGRLTINGFGFLAAGP